MARFGYMGRSLVVALGILSGVAAAIANPPSNQEGARAPEVEETQRPRRSHSGFGGVALPEDLAESVAESASGQRTGDLIGRSALLGDGEYWTLVPREAVLVVPERHQPKLLSAPAGRVVEWTEFLRRNRGWLQTQEVTLDQARGDQEIAGAVRDAMTRSGRVIVAVHKGRPISVKALKQP